MALAIPKNVCRWPVFFRKLLEVLGLLLLTMLPATCIPTQTASDVRADDRPLRKTTASEILKVLKATSAVSVTGVSLETQIQDFKDQTGVTVIRDRRLDPESILDFSLPPTATSEQLNAICENLKSASWQPTDQFIYLAPDNAAPRLVVLTDLIRQELKAGLAEKSGVGKSIQIPPENSSPGVELSAPEEPRRIFVLGATAAGWNVINPEVIPHDLWNPVSIPRLPFIELAALILNQFDLSLQRTTDNGIRIVPFDPSQLMQRSCQFAPESRESVTEQIAERYPKLKLRWSGNRMTCTATLAQHCFLQKMARDSRHGPGSSGETRTRAKNSGPSFINERFTLKTDRATTVGQLIEHFRVNGIPVEIAEKDTETARKLLQRPIKVDLKDVPGIDFFPKLFGEHFQRVEVLDQQIILHP